MANEDRRRNVRGKNGGELPEAELEVLACLWNAGPLTAAEIREQINSFRPMAHGSVLTLLNRLLEKGVVQRKKSGKGKSFEYRASGSPKPTHRRILSRLKHRVFGGNSVAMVATLLESESASLEELRELKALLAQLVRDRKQEGKE